MYGPILRVTYNPTSYKHLRKTEKEKDRTYILYRLANTEVNLRYLQNSTVQVQAHEYPKIHILVSSLHNLYTNNIEIQDTFE